MSDERMVVFCATQRTGSAMVVDDFCNVLGAAPIDAERPYTTIFRENAETWPQAWENVRRTNAFAGIVAVKFMFHYTPAISALIAGAPAASAPLTHTFEASKFDAFHAFFRDAVWVHVRRRDVCAQAVSMYFAETSGRWELRAPPSGASAGAGAEVPYARARLMQIAQGFLQERRQWPLFFAHYGVTPTDIVYEEASRDYPRYLDGLLASLGLQAPARPAARRLYKVGTSLYDEFARRLRDDMSEAFGPEVLERAPP